MTPEAQRIAIAEACAFTNLHLEYECDSNKDTYLAGNVPGLGYCIEVPDYLNDLNAIHAVVAEQIVGTDVETERAYIKHLKAILDRSSDDESLLVYEYEVAMTEATADQRAEAFLKTIGKWTE